VVESSSSIVWNWDMREVERCERRARPRIGRRRGEGGRRPLRGKGPRISFDRN
jgi:hypothetical protein